MAPDTSPPSSWPPPSRTSWPPPRSSPACADSVTGRRACSPSARRLPDHTRRRHRVWDAPNLPWFALQIMQRSKGRPRLLPHGRRHQLDQHDTAAHIAHGARSAPTSTTSSSTSSARAPARSRTTPSRSSTRLRTPSTPSPVRRRPQTRRHCRVGHLGRPLQGTDPAAHSDQPRRTDHPRTSRFAAPTRRPRRPGVQQMLGDHRWGTSRPCAASTTDGTQDADAVKDEEVRTGRHHAPSCRVSNIASPASDDPRLGRFDCRGLRSRSTHPASPAPP